MTISYKASALDVARVRLMPSPIGEAVFSLRGSGSPRFLPWPSRPPSRRPGRR